MAFSEEPSGHQLLEVEPSLAAPSAAEAPLVAEEAEASSAHRVMTEPGSHGCCAAAAPAGSCTALLLTVSVALLMALEAAVDLDLEEL